MRPQPNCNYPVKLLCFSHPKSGVLVSFALHSGNALSGSSLGTLGSSSREPVSPSFAAGIAEGQKDPFYPFCAHPGSVSTAMSCSSQCWGGAGQGRFGTVTPQLLAVAAGWFSWSREEFEMFALREWGHLLAEGRCQGFLPARCVLGTGGKQFSVASEPSGCGALGSQCQT